MPFKNNTIFKMRDAFGIGYSFSKKQYAEYTISYEDTSIFTYFKRFIGGEAGISTIYEVYTGSDDMVGMRSILKFFSVSYALIQERMLSRLDADIESGKILEIHYSVDPIDKDITLYIYSKEIACLTLIAPEKNIALPYADSERDIHMFCLKLKVNSFSSLTHASMVVTSHNFENKDAYQALKNSPLFPKDFTGNQIIEDEEFITYEIAYSLDTKSIENFTLFYFPRAKNAKSASL